MLVLKVPRKGLSQALLLASLQSSLALSPRVHLSCVPDSAWQATLLLSWSFISFTSTLLFGFYQHSGIEFGGTSNFRISGLSLL